MTVVKVAIAAATWHNGYSYGEWVILPTTSSTGQGDHTRWDGSKAVPPRDVKAAAVASLGHCDSASLCQKPVCRGKAAIAVTAGHVGRGTTSCHGGHGPLGRLGGHNCHAG